MKTSVTSFNFLLLFICLVCAGCNPISVSNIPRSDNRGGLVRVYITDKTFVHYYHYGQPTAHKSITKPDDIKDFQVELDSMKEVQNMNIQYNAGYYDMILSFKDGTSQEASLIYTIYDGVVFYNDNTNKSYKNNGMEELVRSYFPGR